MITDMKGKRVREGDALLQYYYKSTSFPPVTDEPLRLVKVVKIIDGTITTRITMEIMNPGIKGAGNIYSLNEHDVSERFEKIDEKDIVAWLM